MLMQILGGLALAQGTPQPMPTTPVPAQPEPFKLDFQPQAAPAQPAGFNYDRVFLAPLQPYDPSVAQAAANLTATLDAELRKGHTLQTIREVPPWPDYGADVYMMSCPVGQYAGCALVCGNRIQTQWTIGGTVTPGMAGDVNVDLVFIENANAREVLSFSMGVNEQDPSALVYGVNTVFQRILGGAFAQVDLRRVDEDPAERAKLDRAQREILAASLTEYERQQGAVSRTDIDDNREKLTKEQTAAMRARDDLKPWERVDMSEGEYRRFTNSGRDLRTWRRLRRGRLGQIVGRLGLGGGVGPYGQTMDSRYTRDDQLQVSEIEQYQFVSQDPSLQIDFEAGFGVLPFLDITGLFSWHNGPFHYFINEEREGQPVVIRDDEFRRRAIGSWKAGVRANFVPLMVSPVRPTLHGGFAYWQGSTWNRFIQGVDSLSPMPNNSVTVVQAGAGVELAAGQTVNLFARGFADVPTGGNRSEQIKVGDGRLQERADPAAFRLSAVGFSVQAGLVIRIPVIGGTDTSSGSTIRFEDEDI